MMKELTRIDIYNVQNWWFESKSYVFRIRKLKKMQHCLFYTDELKYWYIISSSFFRSLYECYWCHVKQYKVSHDLIKTDSTEGVCGEERHKTHVTNKKKKTGLHSYRVSGRRAFCSMYPRQGLVGLQSHHDETTIPEGSLKFSRSITLSSRKSGWLAIWGAISLDVQMV